MEKTIGAKEIAAAISCARVFRKSISGRDKYFASASAVKILQVSTGCKFIKPNGIQLLEPFTVFPTTNVAAIRSIPNAYNRLGVAVKNLLSVSKINTASMV